MPCRTPSIACGADTARSPSSDSVILQCSDVDIELTNKMLKISWGEKRSTGSVRSPRSHRSHPSEWNSQSPACTNMSTAWIRFSNVSFGTWLPGIRLPSEGDGTRLGIRTWTRRCRHQHRHRHCCECSCMFDSRRHRYLRILGKREILKFVSRTMGGMKFNSARPQCTVVTA